MAIKNKVVFEYPVKEIHGKPCSHTNTYFGKNKFSGKLYISRLCNPSTVVTAGMAEQRQKFADASTYANTHMRDATKRAAAELRFNAQSKYYTLRTFLMAESLNGNEVN